MNGTAGPTDETATTPSVSVALDYRVTAGQAARWQGRPEPGGFGVCGRANSAVGAVGVKGYSTLYGTLRLKRAKVQRGTSSLATGSCHWSRVPSERKPPTISYFSASSLFR